jgi:hypothetical protein
MEFQEEIPGKKCDGGIKRIEEIEAKIENLVSAKTNDARTDPIGSGGNINEI